MSKPRAAAMSCKVSSFADQVGRAFHSCYERTGSRDWRISLARRSSTSSSSRAALSQRCRCEVLLQLLCPPSEILALPANLKPQKARRPPVVNLELGRLRHSAENCLHYCLHFHDSVCHVDRSLNSSWLEWVYLESPTAAEPWWPSASHLRCWPPAPRRPFGVLSLERSR